MYGIHEVGSSNLPGSTMKILLVLVDCDSVKEADNIGRRVLKDRLAAGFDVFSRYKSQFFWPAKSGKTETKRGCLLIFKTLPKYFKKLEKLIKKIHSDQLPFIGSIEVDNLSPEFGKWMRGELK